MTFEQLELIEPLRKALSESGYTIPTPIQEQSIPLILKGKDLFGCAQTGTGKTASFALPILQRMYEKEPQPARQRVIKALVLAPTRELAAQIGESFTAYGAHLPYRTVVIFGGVSAHAQIQKLRQGADILVATPGRLIDLVQQGHIHLKQLEYFVLDEADRMLDMGFIHDIKRVLKLLPDKKQSLFFSATVPDSIMELSGSILKDPARVAVTPPSSASVQVRQLVYFTDKKRKRDLLRHILKTEGIDHALVFTRTKRGADRLAKDLAKVGVKAEAIHGNKSQNARERALGAFKDRQITLLIATDIASRGIDIDKLSHVINYELPEHAENYVHRIGRTGRAGETGIAIALCSDDEKDYLKDIQKLIKQQLEVVADHPFTGPYVPTAEEQAEERPVHREQRQPRQQQSSRQQQQPRNRPENRRPQQPQQQRTQRPQPGRTPRPERPAQPAQKERSFQPGRKPKPEVRRPEEQRQQEAQFRSSIPTPSHSDSDGAWAL